MEKWLIQGENAPNCHEQTSSSIRAGACQPQGGVPRYQAADLDLIFCKKTHKKQQQICFGQRVNTLAKTLGKDSLNSLGRILQC
jgi:hypothetical protein